MLKRPRGIFTVLWVVGFVSTGLTASRATVVMESAAGRRVVEAAEGHVDGVANDIGGGMDSGTGRTALGKAAISAIAPIAVNETASGDVAPPGGLGEWWSSRSSSTLSVPALVARSALARGLGQGRGDRPGARLGEVDGDDGAVVTVQTGMAAGCARIEGMDPPTLDCTLRAGESFVETVKATVEGADDAKAMTVQLEPSGLPPHMSLRKLDDTGQETGEPLRAQGELNARLRFAPTAQQATRPRSPVEVDIVARAQDEHGNDEAKAVISLRLHVLETTRSIVGYKFEDKNGNGQRDIDEPGLASWGISLADAQGRAAGTTSTDANGRFLFEINTAGVYTVAEESRDGWVPTRPDAVQLNVQDVAAGPVIEVLFGNRRQETRPRVSGAVSTDRGCREHGNDAAYTLGAPMTIYFGVAGLAEADVSLKRVGADGSDVSLFARRRVPGGQPYSFQNRAGDTAGNERLVMEAYWPADGSLIYTAECNYAVNPAPSPAVDYSPERVDFGSVARGGKARQILTLRNVGQSPLYLSSVSMQGGGGSPFTFLSPNLAGLTLPPGQSYQVDLQFAPYTSGDYQDFVVIRCNATNQPIVTVPVFGQTYDAQPDASAYIGADRGCLEDQQNPLYFVGDPIQFSFRIDSAAGGYTQGQAKVEDILPSGQSKVVYNRQVALNQTVSLGGARIIPPVGDETLRLTAQVGNYVARDECTFRVAAGGTRIIGYKYQDQNGNGLWEGCPTTPWNPGAEPPIPGWGITLTGPQSYQTTTDASGRFEFVVSAPGTYYVTEESRSGWYATRPTSVSFTVQCYPGEAPAPILFGNKQSGCGACPCQPCPGGTPGPGAPTATPWNPPPPPGTTPTATPWFPPPQATATPTFPAPPPNPPPGSPPPPPPVSVPCTVQISPRPSLMNVAELAQFTASVSGAAGTPGYQWTVSGEVIRDYAELTRQGWSTSAMQPQDFQRSTIGFYWKPEPNQRHPDNSGPQPRQVEVTATVAGGSCTDRVTLNVERNNNSTSRQAEDFYLANHNQAVLVEHTLWHAQYPWQAFNYDGTLFFDFHRQYLDRFNSWRAEFGYPPLGIWDSGTGLPRGVDVDHAARGAMYTPLAKPSWFTLGGLVPRSSNGQPCDTRAGQRRLGDYPADRRLLGCAVTHTWHNGVHTGIGGDMLNPQWSPRDPVFWRWHNFVDIVSQERMSVLFAAANLAENLARGDAAGAPGRTQQHLAYPPHVTYQVPFRLYRFMDEPLSEYAVLFDQPVSGVKAADLTVNGMAATAVTGDREGPYVFRGFPPPAEGPIEVRLAAGAIKNLENEGFQGNHWPYVRVDPVPDEDRDGILSLDEVRVHFTNPQDRDSDDDGLADGDEVALYHTRPLMWDSDRDSASDKCELESGSDPNDPASQSKGCPVTSVFVCWAGNGEPIDR